MSPEPKNPLALAMGSVKLYRILDKSTLDRSKIKQDPISGFIRVPVALTRVQVREYDPGEIHGAPLKDGQKTIKIAFSAQTIKDAASKFDDATLVVMHPDDDWVTTDNIAKLGQGHIAKGVFFDEQDMHNKGEAVLTHPEAINLVMSRKMTEVSIGAPGKIQFEDCRLLDDGTLSMGLEGPGQPADGWCSQMGANHVALVPAGRAGPTCRMILDQKPSRSNTSMKEIKMKEITLAARLIDGNTILSETTIKLEEVSEPAIVILRDREKKLFDQLEVLDTARHSAEDRAKQAEAKLKDSVPLSELEVQVKETLEARSAAMALNIEIKDGASANQLKLDVIKKVQPSVYQHLLDAKRTDNSAAVDAAFVSATVDLKDAAETADIKQFMDSGSGFMGQIPAPPNSMTPRERHALRYGNQ